MITDVALALPVDDRPDGKRAVDDSALIWKNRVSTLQRALNELASSPSPHVFGEAFPAVYFRDPLLDLPVSLISNLPLIAFTTSERIALHLIERLIPSLQGLPGVAHIAIGDPRDDINKQTMLNLLGINIPSELYPIVMDPLGLGSQTGLRRKPSVELITDASSSGASALVSGAIHIERGTVNTTVVVSSTGKTVPAPAETVPLGFGADRSALPFEDLAAGHYYSEGGIGFTLHEARFAQEHRIEPLASIVSTAFGSFGSGVANRMVIAEVIERCLALGGVAPDTPVFIDLYGRGNSVDDDAELSAVEMVAKSRPGVQSGYLKGGSHYIIGSHGLLGLARLLDAVRKGTSVSDLASHPDSERLRARPKSHLRADPADFTNFVFVSFSIHGSCVAILATREMDLP